MRGAPTAPENRVAALVLAAGQGTRFGDGFKLLARHRGLPLVRHAVSAALRSRADPVLVVVGHRAPEVRAALADLPVGFVPNPRFAEGLSTSLQAGFLALPATAQAAVVVLGDMPAIGPAVIDGLIERFQAGGLAGAPAAVVPVHGGRRGNPVLLSRRLAPEIAGLTGDVGAASLLRRRGDVEDWPVEEAGVLLDVDTEAALAALSHR